MCSSPRVCSAVKGWVWGNVRALSSARHRTRANSRVQFEQQRCIELDRFRTEHVQKISGIQLCCFSIKRCSGSSFTSKCMMCTLSKDALSSSVRREQLCESGKRLVQSLSGSSRIMKHRSLICSRCSSAPIYSSRQQQVIVASTLSALSRLK